MFGSPEIFPTPAVEYFFYLHSVQSPVCPFDFSCASKCAGRGKQVWGSVLTKGKGLVKREEPLAFVNPGSYTGLNRQQLTLHRKFRMGTHDGRRRMQ